jgi:hypothetical protein
MRAGTCLPWTTSIFVLPLTLEQPHFLFPPSSNLHLPPSEPIRIERFPYLLIHLYHRYISLPVPSRLRQRLTVLSSQLKRSTVPPIVKMQAVRQKIKRALSMHDKESELHPYDCRLPLRPR